MIDKDTKIYGSFSSNPGNNGCKFFNNMFKKEGINAIYKSFYSGDIKASLDAIRSLGILGVAISMPFKTEILELLDEVEEQARCIGSVNTVVNKNGKLIGYNTDYLAITETLVECNVTALYIIGTGGFSKAAQHACDLMKIPYKIIDRTNFGNLSFYKNKTILNCTPVENIKVDSSNQFIDGIPTTKTGKILANKQAIEQYKLYIKNEIS